MRATLGYWLLGAVVAAGPNAPRQTTPATPAGPAAQSLGKTRTVCGTVAAIRPSRTGDVLDVDGTDLQQRLSVFLPGRDGFDTAAAARVKGLRICVLGRIEQDAGGLLIKLKDLTTLRAAVLEIARPVGFPADANLDLTDGRNPPGVVQPKLVQQPGPRYNSVAMRARVQGDVRLEGVVGADVAVIVTLVLTFRLH